MKPGDSMLLGYYAVLLGSLIPYLQGLKCPDVFLEFTLLCILVLTHMLLLSINILIPVWTVVIIVTDVKYTH